MYTITCNGCGDEEVIDREGRDFLQNHVCDKKSVLEKLKRDILENVLCENISNKNSNCACVFCKELISGELDYDLERVITDSIVWTTYNKK